jgi:hypothetical protein
MVIEAKMDGYVYIH